jgi:hypothetical protein
MVHTPAGQKPLQQAEALVKPEENSDAGQANLIHDGSDEVVGLFPRARARRSR